MEQYGAIWSNMTYSVEYEMAPRLCAHAPNVADTVQWHLAMALRWLKPVTSTETPPKLHRSSTHSKQNETKKCRTSAFPTVVDLKDLPCPSCNLCKLDVLSRSIHNRGEVHKRIVVPAMTADSWTDLMKRFHEEIWTVISVISCKIAVDVIESPCRNFGARHLCVASLRSKGEHLSGEQLSTTSTTLLWGSTARPLRLLNALLYHWLFESVWCTAWQRQNKTFWMNKTIHSECIFMYFYVQTPSAVFPLMEVKLSLQQRTCESFKERAAQSSAKQYTNSRRFKMHIWVHFWVHFDKNSTKDLTKDRKILESSAWFLWPFDPQAEALKQVEECLAVDPLILSSSSTKPAVEIQMFTQFSMFSHAISIILDLSHVRNCSVLVRRLFLVRHEPPQCPTGNLNRNVAKHCIAGMSWDMSWHMSWHML